MGSYLLFVFRFSVVKAYRHRMMSYGPNDVTRTKWRRTPQMMSCTPYDIIQTKWHHTEQMMSCTPSDINTPNDVRHPIWRHTDVIWRHTDQMTSLGPNASNLNLGCGPTVFALDISGDDLIMYPLIIWPSCLFAFIMISLSIKWDGQNLSCVAHSLPTRSSVCMHRNVLLGSAFAFCF